MSDALRRRFLLWVEKHRKRLGPTWKEDELAWTSNGIVNQYIREAAYFHSSTDDFEDWLDEQFATASKAVQ